MSEQPLTSEQRERYARHLLLPHVGARGQQALVNARVLVVGAGGLGAPVLTYLAAAGVGTIGIIDDDRVELSNLQRQVIHGTSDVGELKVTSAASTLRELNPGVATRTYPERLDGTNVFEIVGDYDVVVDGTDNFATRYLLNDACALRGIPYVWAAIFQFDAALSVFHAGHGPCYRCIYPTPPAPGAVPSCAEGGVLGALPGLIGNTQAIEALKLILGIGRPLIGRLASYEALTGEWEYIPVAANPDCELCGRTPRIVSEQDVVDAWVDACGLPARPGSATIEDGAATSSGDTTTASGATPAPDIIEPGDLAEFLRTHTGATLLDVRTPGELEIVAIPDAENIELDVLLESPGAAPRTGPIVVFCKTGARSIPAAAALRADGHQVLELAGGIMNWVSVMSPDSARY